MKNKLHTILAVMLLGGLFLLCLAGCQANSSTQSTQNGDSMVGDSMTIIGGEETDSGLQEGSFAKPNQMEQIASNAKELGGSKTLSIEFPEEEELPDQDNTEATEPQWHPGIW